MSKIFVLIAMVCLTFVCTSCYRMPTEYDYCVVPSTNNPAVTMEKPQGPTPQMQY